MSTKSTYNSSLFTQTEASFYDSGVSKDYDLQLEALVIRSVTAVLSIISFYLALSLITFWIYTRWIKKKKSTEHNHATTLNSLCAFAALMIFLRVGIPLEILLAYNNNLNCVVVMEYRIVTYGLALSALYTVLWLRQRVFYNSPVLKALTTGFVKFLSFSTPIIIILGCVVAIILVNFSETFVPTKFGCAIQRTPLNIYSWIFRGVAFIAMQLILLSLLIYPLLKHRKTMKSTVSKNTNSIDNLLKRVLITTLVCVVMDSISNLIGVIYKRDLAIVHHFVYDITILIDLIAVISSFKNWRNRLFPWRNIKCVRSDDVENVSANDCAHSVV